MNNKNAAPFVRILQARMQQARTERRLTPSIIAVIIVPISVAVILICVAMLFVGVEKELHQSHILSPMHNQEQLLKQAMQRAIERHQAQNNATARLLLRGGGQQQDDNHPQTTTTTNNEKEESMESLRQRLKPSIWTVADKASDPAVTKLVSEKLLTAAEKEQGLRLCGKFLYSSMEKAVQVGDLGEHTFVATGDIDSMWTRDSAVQMGIYVGRMGRQQPFLRLVVQGAIRRQAFNIIQDPYANAYSRKWKDPSARPLRERVIGRGGWVDTRNYEVDSGAYFLTQLYDYYVAEHLYRPEVLLAEPIIFDAVMLMVQTYIVEQNHETNSPYRYFELPEGGKGSKTGYTGMTWSGFRPSDDKCQYGYLVPSNIHAAAGLERVLELNKRIWKSEDLEAMTSKLLREMEEGIRKYGVVEVPARSGTGMEKIYAYEVDGLGKSLHDFDDANVPSLLSIPLLGWSGYDREIYQNTRARLLDPKFNKYYYQGETLRGMGSPHTPVKYVWPLALSIEALTEEGPPDHRAQAMAFQVQQSLKSACNDAMHEGVDSRRGCPLYTRPWFEWANAMFVVLIETALGERCDAQGKALALQTALETATQGKPVGPGSFFENKFHNDHKVPEFYQGIEAKVKYVS
ncbi:DUF1237 domain-containing protein [Seminavis robusta]|uniref:DUF1237 domain-containing protein n=1 Tax=Seminavis robusta TaxID=568900 RepID=A0A9N8D9U5_9STRA|nr:DUF1237 domain-containing protein [Seminavis robusta]|eukprot:Sro27_g018080.1 DUF1237 domain-containing protein (630) ;mRNA; r:32291-34180